MSTFFNTENKSVALFGVLIRDTLPNVNDLSKRGEVLREKFSLPTRCDLIALYLPRAIQELPQKIRSGGKS